MELCLSNIGKIHSACVEINGITVIAGENNTGKSTIGKALFAVFNSFYNSENKIAAERLNSIRNQLQMLFRRASGDVFYEIDDADLARSIMKLAKSTTSHLEGQRSQEELKQAISSLITHYDDRLAVGIDDVDIEEFSRNIAVILAVDDAIIFRTVLQRRLDAEFNGQICNLYANNSPSDISIRIRDERINIRIIDDKVSAVDRRYNLGTEAIYIDDPFILDEIPSSRIWRFTRYADHRTHLKDKLNFGQSEANVIEEIVANSKLDYIYHKISSVCSGDVVKGKRSNLSYKVPGSDTMLDVRSLSTGLKTFVILKTLLVHGQIEANGTIILDEPEIHLHPEWQLLFAELIVLLHREFGLHILLNTHSPYFLNAIEVYAAKYKVSDRCKYYLAKNAGNISYIDDVSDNVEEIYSRLARPLQDLENEAYRYD